MEFNRVIALSTITSELGVAAIAERYVGTGFDVDTQSVVEDVIQNITECYFDGGLKMNVRSGYIPSSSQISGDIPVVVAKALRESRKKGGKAVAHRNGWGEASLAIRIALGPATYDVWFSSTDYVFTETDEAFVTAMKDAVQYNFERAFLSRHEQEIIAALEN